MSESKKKGNQFLNKVDMSKISNDFIISYYNTWKNDVHKLVTSPIWKTNTKVNLDGKNLTPQETVYFHQNLQNAHFENIHHQYVSDGSRRLDIMVKGKVSKGGHYKIFVQTFALVELKGTFYIKSTQFFFI